MDGVILTQANGTGVQEEKGKGTPPALPPDPDQAETLEETYARLGVPYSDDGADAPESLEAEDDDSEESTDEDEVEETEAEESAEEPETEETDWAAIVRESPARITEIPAKQRGDVLQKLFEQERATADERVRQTRTQVQQEFETWKAAWQRMSNFVREIDDLRDNDPDRYSAWENANPQYAAAYHRYRAELKNPTPPQPQQQQDPDAEYRAQTQPYIKAVNRSPRAKEIWDELERRDPNQQVYVHTEDGVNRFIQDVEELLSGGGQAQKDESRKKAAESRASKPKGDGAPSKSKSKLTKSQIQQMSNEQVAALSLEELEEAMASR